MKTASTLIIGSMLVLTACGQTAHDRTLSGAGIGAATGAAAGAIVAGNPWAGAAVGGAVGAGVGAAAGALTTPDEVNLGKPIWR